MPESTSNRETYSDSVMAVQSGSAAVRLREARRFLDQFVELLHEDYGLELLHAVVAAAGEIRLCAFEAARRPSHVVEGMASIQ